jgi:MFS family permease
MLSNHAFRNYLAAQVSSEFGSMFTATAAGVLAVNTFGAGPGEVGAIVAAGSLPALVFGLASGTVADRIRHPRRVLMGCDIAAAAVLVTLVIGVWTGVATVWWLAGLTLAVGTIGVLISPVYFTHLGNLVAGQDAEAGPTAVTRARAQLQVGQYAARLSGRAAAGPVIALAATLGLLVDAATYLVSLVLLRLIRVPDVGAARPAAADEPAGRPSALRETAEGARQMWRLPLLRSLSAFMLVMTTTGAATAALLAPYLLGTLHLPVAVFSLMFAASGAAGLLGSVLATRLVRRVPGSLLTVGGFAFTALSMLVLPAATGGHTARAAIAAAGLALPVLGSAVANIGLVGVITADVPEYVLGRVTATIQTTATVSGLVGALAGGLLGDLLGVRAAMWVGALVAVAALATLVPVARLAWTTRHAATSGAAADGTGADGTGADDAREADDSRKDVGAPVGAAV